MGEETKPVVLKTWDSFISAREPLEIVEMFLIVMTRGGSTCAIDIHLIARGWGCYLTSHKAQGSSYIEK